MKITNNLYPKAVIGVIIIFIGVIHSCKKESRWDCIKRTGETTTDIRILPPFTKIYLTDNVNVFITQGSTQEVKVEAGKNLISLAITEVLNGTLHLENDNRCDWARSYKNGTITVYLTMPTLRYITHAGSGQLKSQNTITCDTLDVSTKESGDVELSVNANIIFTRMGSTADITLHGKSVLMGIYHMGEGYLRCENLQTNITWSHSKASGNEYLNAKNFLAVTIDWAGDIYYTGNPVLDTKGTGSGKLIQQ